MFERESRKAARNLEKHGVSFEETMSCSHSKSEDRYVAIAKSERGRILTFIFTVRRSKDGKEKFRIISSRCASKKERKVYPRS
ncbi:BrnT family toxin [bacterium]|nr:BrnT family toxin [bacterium]